MPFNFERFDVHNKDFRLLILIFLFGIIILTVGDIASGLSVAAFTLYFVMFISMALMVFLAFATKGRGADIRMFGNIRTDPNPHENAITRNWRFYVAITVPLFVGILFTLKQLFNINTLLDISALLPPLASAGAVASSPGFGYFVVAFMAPLLEESWRAGLLEPSLRKWIPIVGLGPILIILGGSMAFILYQSAWYVGVTIAIIGLFLLAVPQLREKTRLSNTSQLVIVGIILVISTLIGATLFAALHIYAYGGLPDFYSALLSVGFFAVVADVMDFGIFNSIIPGIVFHSVVNGILYGTQSSISIGIGFTITAFLIMILILANQDFGIALGNHARSILGGTEVV